MCVRVCVRSAICRHILRCVQRALKWPLGPVWEPSWGLQDRPNTARKPLRGPESPRRAPRGRTRRRLSNPTSHGAPKIPRGGPWFAPERPSKSSQRISKRPPKRPTRPPKIRKRHQEHAPPKQKPKLLQRASMTTHEAFRGRNSEDQASMDTIRKKSLRNINNDDDDKPKSTTKSLREYGPPPLSDHIWADLAFIRQRKQNYRERGRSGA